MKSYFPAGLYRARAGVLAGLSYWNELVGEVDQEIDLLSQEGYNVHSGAEGLRVMDKPPVKSKDELLIQQREAAEQRRREDNAKKAREAADQLFPGEKWKPVEEGIYLSPHRPVGKNSNYKDELHDAQILRDLGSTVYFLPESRSEPGKKYDAIVNGQKFEFKNIHGKENALIHQFLRSRSQAPNAFINLETSNLTRREVMSSLYGARNSHEYGEYNRFSGGKIVLKIKGQTNLIYLNVDDLKAPGQ